MIKGKGRKIAKQIRESIAGRISKLDIKPLLVTILIGSNSASKLYVRMKNRACKQVGILTQTYYYPKGVSAMILHKRINQLNHDTHVTGILIEKPYSVHGATETQVDDWIAPKKDVDGTNMINFGKLARDGMSDNILMPCTPQAVITLLEHSGIRLDQWNGLHVSIINRSEIVGLPLASMMIHKGAEVTVLNHHANGTDIANADVVVAATGQPDLIDSRMVSPRQILIPVSEVRMEDGRLHGDFSQKALRKAHGFSQLGNVGPLCIAYLLLNCCRAYQTQND